MISYELAKKLKEAGWDKKTYWFYGIDETDTPQLTNQLSCLDTVGIRFVNGQSEKAVDCYAPTLSELIEECVELSENGDFHLVTIGGKWEATTCWKHGDDDSKWKRGNTAEEVVALLWLKLNPFNRQTDDMICS